MKGSIQKHVARDGKVTYYGRVEVSPDPVTGKRRWERISGTSKKDVENLVAQAIARVSRGGSAEADAQKITVEEYLTRWLQHAKTSLKPGSYGNYGEVIRLHINPTLGRIRLAKLTPLHVQSLYNDLLEKGLSRSSVHKLHCIFHKALDQAMKWGLVFRNVTEAATPPSRPKPEYIVWNPEQVRAFLAQASKDEYAMIWRLAVYTGMRRGELLALKWEDVDFERKVLSVKRTYSRGTDNKYEMGSTKTASSRRQITLPSSVVEGLRAHYIRQMEARLELGVDYLDHGLVFANDIGQPIAPTSLARHFQRIIDTACLPQIRIHDLRHGHATVLMEDGVHPKVVSERLGHSNTRITLDLYSHVTPTMQRQVSDRLERLIEGNVPTAD